MRILITAGPTREYLDDVRFLSNASSGRMGYALAEAARDAGHAVVLVSGPVGLARPAGVEFLGIETTTQLRDACVREFPRCDGVIGVAAVCDYRPKQRHAGKLSKTGAGLVLELEETPDILAELGTLKGDRWSVGFALEAERAEENALRKLRAKRCDAIVLNGPAAIGAADNTVHVIDATGAVAATISGDKGRVAVALIDWIERHIPQRRSHATGLPG